MLIISGVQSLISILQDSDLPALFPPKRRLTYKLIFLWCLCLVLFAFCLFFSSFSLLYATKRRTWRGAKVRNLGTSYPQVAPILLRCLERSARLSGLEPSGDGRGHRSMVQIQQGMGHLRLRLGESGSWWWLDGLDG